MCGISGVFGRPDGETVRAMLSSLAHRGPDDEFQVEGAEFALGARRLSIVGLADGRQPISNEDGTVWAAHNGELYNYPAIKRELSARGHLLHTHCDTEILPHLYEDYGERLPEFIDGMFAIAIWDGVRHEGLLARDRAGKKPLYYYRNGDSLYFASEIKALLRVPGFERRINLEALHHFLGFKHVPSPLTIFQGISILPPAHSLRFRPGSEPEISRYWNLSFATAPDRSMLSEEDLVEQLSELLKQAIKRRLMSDVPIGFFLSGGIDSSLSTAMAAEVSPGPIKTFTLTFAKGSTSDGKERDRHWARWVANKFGTEHHEEEIVTSDFPQNLRRVIGCFDEPFAGTLSTYFLAGLIARHVKVAISGDGADELFGSYLSHRLAFPLAAYQEYQRTRDESLIKPFEARTAYLAQLADDKDWKWRAKLLVLSDEEKLSLYSPDIKPAMRGFSSLELLRRQFCHLTAQDPLNRILEAEFHTLLPDQVLAFVDRLSMAHSLEVRTPYLDTNLMTFVAGLSGHWKIRAGETKYLLKKAALRYFPHEMVFRQKEGFIMPITQWILGDLHTYVRETLSANRLDRHGIFDSRRVGELVDRLYAQGGDYTDVNKIFALVVFQEWYDLYF
jgi:asparagine synthase (glutamine-hydrolysing)